MNTSPYFFCIFLGCLCLGEAARIITTNALESIGESDTCPASLQNAVHKLTVRDLFTTSGTFSYWAGAKGVSLIANTTNTTWEKLIAKDVFIEERKRLLALGRLDRGNETIRGVCDLSLQLLKGFARSPILHSALREVVGPSCLAPRGEVAIEQVTAALDAECFTSCYPVLSEHASDCGKEACFKKTCWTNETFGPLMEKSRQCADLPFDTVERLAEFSMWSLCLDFIPPSPLWQISDSGPGDATNVGPSPICGLKDKNTSYEQRGVCPEGSKCKCPMSDVKSRPTAAEIRGKFTNGELVGKNNPWLNEGSASFSSFMSQYRNGLVGSIFIGELLVAGTATITGAVLNVLALPTFLVTGTAVIGVKSMWSWATFKCQDTVGCWPDRAVRKTNITGTPRACRMPEKSRSGGSPVWFLPPPGTRAILNSWGSSCEVEGCAIEDWIKQSVGFVSKGGETAEDKTNIYNCQPLRFEEMQPAQRQLLLRKLLATGVHEEYDVSRALAAADMTLEDALTTPPL